MGLLEKLWDDTLAGPHPDSGLGRLRRFNTFNARSTPSKDLGYGGERLSSSSSSNALSDENNPEVKVSRKIMIVKPPGYNTQSGGGSSPASPAGSTPPSSPFSDQEHSGFGGDLRQTRMRSHRMRRQPSETLLLLKMSDI